MFAYSLGSPKTYQKTGERLNTMSKLVAKPRFLMKIGD